MKKALAMIAAVALLAACVSHEIETSGPCRFTEFRVGKTVLWTKRQCGESVGAQDE